MEAGVGNHKAMNRREFLHPVDLVNTVGDFRLYIYTLTGAGVDNHKTSFRSSWNADLDRDQD